MNSVVAPDADTRVAGNGSVAEGREASGKTIALLLESDGPGGAEIMLLQLAEELRRRGHRVIPVGPWNGCGWLGERLAERGFHQEKFMLRRALDAECVRSLTRLIDLHDIDIMHSHEFTMAVYGALASRLRGRKHVTTMHGSSIMTEKWRRRVALRVAFRGSRVVAVSGHTRDHLVSTLGVPSSRIEHIPNGIRPEAGRRAPVRSELGLGDDDVLVVAVGNLIPRKGHIHLLRALASLDRGGLPRNWHVAIAGRGEERERLAAFANERGFGDRLHLLGHRDDVPDILAASDIFTMPSLWEGLPVALLEAMFAGKPVIASGVSGIPEAIHNETHGLLTAPGDEAAIERALVRLLTDRELRATLGNAASARASECYSVERMTDAYERQYGLRV
jgi:L-malate glycosyltransferase